MPSTSKEFEEFYRKVLADAERQQQQQSASAQAARQAQYSGLQNQLNQMGAGQSALSGIGGMPVQNKPMTPPKFLQGYKVTVRSGNRVWIVQRMEERQTPYGQERLYILQEETGSRQVREPENDLRIFDTPGAVAAKPKAKVDFDSVIIADEKRQQILEALEQINQQDLIFDKWGFGETIEKGKGVSLLFYGPPGTGKTLMAQALANKLNMVLNIVSTADIESSAPGEAERNIRKHFAEAKEKNSILLFDECDSLIYTRQNVGPILGAQINELLSQIERFDGITIFTTNRLGTLDEAVNRRLALKLEFEMPTIEERAKIWQRMFPKKAPLEKDIDWMKLAIIEVTGGYIKNAVLRAARMAAIEKMPDKKKKITMRHLIKALRLETESMIEFENARKKQEGRIGHVTRDGVSTATGQKVIHKLDKRRGRG